MEPNELRQKILDELEQRFGSTHKYSNPKIENKPCTLIIERVDGSEGARSLSFGEVADAAVTAALGPQDEPTT